MEIDSFLESIRYFVDNVGDISIAIYALLGPSSVLKQLDIEGASLDHLKEMFVNKLKEEIIDIDGLFILPLSISEERDNAIYRYDLDFPEEFSSVQMLSNSDDIDKLNLSKYGISDIKALLIELGNESHQIVLFKSISRINIFSRDKFFLKRNDERLKRIDDDFIRIDPGFQIIKLGDSYYAMDQKKVERMFGVREIIIQAAKVGSEKIKEMDILVDPSSLDELIDDDVSFAKKLVKVSKASPLLNMSSRIDNAKIIRFCKAYPGIKDRLSLNRQKDKINLTSKKSKHMFLDVLMDSFLLSELTQVHYHAYSKDNIDGEASETRA